ncbi:hypothetical protein BDN72DRAFT_904018 [Pluteus cervinus]|uniref:Uncharacterized protein n=1 Tax=Pluteus cervinus TaxID=181527 RepID=A0ACD3A9N4_9AGAR|nr:hypothetical protein BDN72DRAFT_904018 [Pluteus cervinus]
MDTRQFTTPRYRCDYDYDGPRVFHLGLGFVLRLNPAPNFHCHDVVDPHDGDKRYELWSPNAELAIFPGVRPENFSLDLPHLNPRFDGSGGRWDFTLNPQYLECGKLHHAFIRRTTSYSLSTDPPEFWSLTDHWAPCVTSLEKNGAVDSHFYQNLKDRSKQLLKQAEVINRDHRQELQECSFWLPEPPKVAELDCLSALAQPHPWEDQVDRLAHVQRQLKELAGWVECANAIARTPYSIKAQASKLYAQCFPSGDERFLGVWAHGDHERAILWLLGRGIPCYFAHQYRENIEYGEHIALDRRNSVVHGFVPQVTPTHLSPEHNPYFKLALRQQARTSHSPVLTIPYTFPPTPTSEKMQNRSGSWIPRYRVQLKDPITGVATRSITHVGPDGTPKINTAPVPVMNNSSAPQHDTNLIDSIQTTYTPIDFVAAPSQAESDSNLSNNLPQHRFSPYSPSSKPAEKSNGLMIGNVDVSLELLPPRRTLTDALASATGSQIPALRQILLSFLGGYHKDIAYTSLDISPINGTSPPLQTNALTFGTFVISSNAGFYLRYWHILFPDLPFIALIGMAVQRGLQVRLTVKTSDIRSMLPASIRPPRPPPEMLPQGILPTGIAKWNQKRKIDPHRRACALYMEGVRSVLRLPRARRLILEGGLLWRIALQWDGPMLYQICLHGPSPLALHYRIGETHPNLELFDDDLPDSVMNILLGVQDNGLSLWPSPALLECSRKWYGLWNEDLEKWFQARASLISSGTAKAHSDLEWGGLLRCTRIKGVIGSETHMQRLCESLDVNFPELCSKNWTGPYSIVLRDPVACPFDGNALNY